MSVQALRQIAATQTPCVPTLRVLTFVVVYKGIVVMGEIVQVDFKRTRETFKEK